MKTRLDFVSNSSSSSYIISSEFDSEKLGPKMFRYSYGRNQNARRKDSMIEHGAQFGEWLKNHSCLSIFSMNFTIPLTGTMKKRFYQGIPMDNTIFGGKCCSDEFLNHCFNKDGEVKQSVKPDKFLNAITWYHITNGRLIFGQEVHKHIDGKSGKITDLSIKFNRWLIDQLSQKYDGIEIKNKDRFLKELDNLEKCIKDRNLYYVTINHDGDGIDEDAAYYSTYGCDGKDPFDPGESYYDLLVNTGVIDELTWLESM